MEKVAQGRVWTGNDAVSVGLVDAVGGMSRAIAIAKQKANIPQEQQVCHFSIRGQYFRAKNCVLFFRVTWIELALLNWVFVTR